MSELHPIPQQIASYQFKLVGDMTLKQFTQLAGGALVSLLIYASPLHPFVRWPLIILSFLFGVALAFLPIEDRPLSTWIFIFFRSIYSPTYFVWIKSKSDKAYFLPEEGETTSPASIKIAEKKEQTQELVEPVIKKNASVENLEKKEKTFLLKVSKQFISPGSSVVVSTTPIHTYSVTPPATSPQYGPIEQESTQSRITQSVGVKPITRDVAVPKSKTIAVNATQQQFAQQPQAVQSQTDLSTSTVTPFLYNKVQKDVEDQKQSFSPDVTPPLPSSRPNVVVGQVVDQNGRIIEGAILEIKDVDGRPVRALKSNRIGHFMIATPLFAGKYVIVAEKDGYEFPIYEIEAKDDLIKPIAIIAKKISFSSESDQKAPDEQKSQRPKEEADFIRDFKI